MSNKLDYKTIKDLKYYRFVIPSYQRGYRWNKIQVEQFIDDIYEEKYKQYYIQPLIVSKIDDEKEKWNVVDGQQRLTTILIMIGALRYLENNNFDEGNNIHQVPFITLEYESRKSSKTFLNFLVNSDRLNEVSKKDLKWDRIWEKFSESEREKIEKNLDFEYMVCAFCVSVNKYETILKELNYNLQELKGELLDRCKFIWYPIEMNSIKDRKKLEIEQFSKINMGKIELTDAELIKAEIMNPKRFNGENQSESKNWIKTKQFSISAIWYFIENELHKPDFWGFIPHRDQYNDTDNYHTRIDILFDFLLIENELNANKKIQDYIIGLNLKYKYSLFLRTVKFLDDNGVDKTWEKIKDIFENLKELYEKDGRTQIYDNQNRNIHNLISFLVFYQQNKEKTNELVYLKNYEIFYKLLKKNRNKRIDFIKEKIKEVVFGKENENIKEKIKNMRYGVIGEELREILLLYNLILLSQSIGIGSRYNFLEHSKQEWSREHIFPQSFKKSSKDNKNYERILKERKEILQLITNNLDKNNNIVLRNEIILRYINYLYGKEGYCKSKNGNMNREYYCPIKCNKKGIIDFINDKDEINSFLKKANQDEYEKEYSNKLKLIFKSLEFLEKMNIMQQNKNFMKQIEENRKLIINHIESNRTIFKKIDDETILSEFYKANQNNYEIEDVTSYIYSKLKEFESIPIEYIREIINLSMKFKDATSIYSSDDRSYENVANDSDFRNNNNSINCEQVIDNLKKILIKIYKYSIENIKKSHISKKTLSRILKITNKSIEDNINSFFENEFDKLIRDNSVGNMTLLSSKLNQEFGNKPYNEKKIEIYEKTKTGDFIPLVTLLAFTDVYTKNRITDKYWMYESRYEYLYDIITTVEDFFKLGR